MRPAAFLAALFAAWGMVHAQSSRPAQAQPAPGGTALLQRSGGSLIRATLNGPADPSRATLAGISLMAVPEPVPKTLRKHDLVTIIIREESKFSSDGSIERTKEASLRAKIAKFPGLDINNLEITPDGIGPVPPEIDVSGSRRLNGDGKVERQDRFTGRITAEVIDVKPNGTLVLQARKRIKTDDEEQAFILTGICRVEDIAVDNTLLSSQIYDLELVKTHKGAVERASTRGVLPKLLDFINAF